MKKRDLEKITTEVMQLQELLPGLLKVHLAKLLYEARAAQKCKLPSNVMIGVSSSVLAYLL